MHRLTAWMGGRFSASSAISAVRFRKICNPRGFNRCKAAGTRGHVLDWHMLGVCAGRGLQQLYLGDLFAEVFDSIGDAPVSLRCRT
jgi:hypothetical protein